ncbi:hypothetical protein C2845_PM11G10550 [Panicum miliaceum]|uniref:Cathepsin propeptide inhibitor domain-containing protein n=1 Tax=Panicum miliaceum TaxID=4540 RepID=A0A3L6RRT3_PANMI|nr:hypothetical protein C2845_PM11G10550 [Panicum miliaceum]
MRRSTVLRVAAAAVLLLLARWQRSEEVETRRMFRDWMAANKKYNSIDEEEHRYAVFKENRRRFDKVNATRDAAGLRLTHLGLNVFADLTNEELRSLHTGCADHQNLAADNKGLPYSVDWSNKGTGGRGQAVSSSTICINWGKDELRREIQ